MTTPPPPPPAIDPATLISTKAIGRKIDRTSKAVREAIARLNITPLLVLNGNYYSRDVIPQIEAAMRRPNAPKTQG